MCTVTEMTEVPSLCLAGMTSTGSVGSVPVGAAECGLAHVTLKLPAGFAGAGTNRW